MIEEKFHSSNYADVVALQMIEYYYPMPIEGVSLELNEEDIYNYLYEVNYRGGDRGRFFDMVMSSLVNQGVNIKIGEEEKYSMGGGIQNENIEDLSFVAKNFYRTTEGMIREHLRNGEICVCKLTKILGKTPDYPNQVVGSLNLKKCFLRPYYSI